MGAQDRPEVAETEARWCRRPLRKEGRKGFGSCRTAEDNCGISRLRAQEGTGPEDLPSLPPPAMERPCSVRPTAAHHLVVSSPGGARGGTCGLVPAAVLLQAPCVIQPELWCSDYFPVLAGCPRRHGKGTLKRKDQSLPMRRLSPATADDSPWVLW